MEEIMIRLLVLNGPNLNMLGKRDASQYGILTLEDIENIIKEYCIENNFNINFFQSNIEGEIIDKIQQSQNEFDGLIINAGGFTHTSVAIRDALECIDIPKVEVHLSNISSRESFRHTSLLTPVCDGAIFGFRENSYLLAVDYFKKIKNKRL
jgi:3-dehydroquinate dehydratase-2